MVSRIVYIHSGPFWGIDGIRKTGRPYVPCGDIQSQFRRGDANFRIFESRKPFPFDRFKTVNRVNAWWAGNRIRKAARFLSDEKWISWFYHPVLAEQVVRSGSDMIVFDSVESIIGHEQYKLATERRLLENYRLLSLKSDVIFCVAEKMIDLLEEKFGRDRSPTHWISNGVRFHDFQRHTTVPDDLKEIPKPVIGYIGVVNDYTDLDLLESLVRRRPRFSFVLVGKTLGKTDISHLLKYSNVYHIPFRPPESLPDYIGGFDVCINIYRNNEIVNTGDSIKIYNFLAAGKPIVSTNVQRIDRFRDFAFIAEDSDSFLTLLDRAVEKVCEDENLVRKRISAAKKYDWSIKVDEMLSIIRKRM